VAEPVVPVLTRSAAERVPVGPGPIPSAAAERCISEMTTGLRAVTRSLFLLVHSEAVLVLVTNVPFNCDYQHRPADCHPSSVLPLDLKAVKL
jgi:hypothetical protein